MKDDFSVDKEFKIQHNGDGWGYRVFEEDSGMIAIQYYELNGDVNSHFSFSEDVAELIIDCIKEVAEHIRDKD